MLIMMLRVWIAYSIGCCICISLSWIWIVILRLRHFLMRLWCCSSLARSVLLHLHLKADLVFCRHVFISLLLLGSQGSPALTKHLSKFDKLDTRIFLENFRPHLVRKENIGTAGTFGSCGVLGSSLVSLARAVVFDQYTTCIMSWRRNVSGDLRIVTGLVLRGTGLPGRLFIRGQVLVHVGGILRKLPKGHARIFSLELLSHGILIQKVSTHVSFRSVDVLLGLALSPSLGVNGRDNGIPLWIVSRGRNVRSKLMQVTSLVGFGSSNPSLFFRRRKF
mmetsp:Transcript_26763/g.77122  ORF Transcript_26763/g.77122 Transcript_26763/m.77122 type:complete len:277 (-) Transcript_26763:351-1181(-)